MDESTQGQTWPVRPSEGWGLVRYSRHQCAMSCVSRVSSTFKVGSAAPSGACTTSSNLKRVTDSLLTGPLYTDLIPISVIGTAIFRSAAGTGRQRSQARGQEEGHLEGLTVVEP